MNCNMEMAICNKKFSIYQFWFWPVVALIFNELQEILYRLPATILLQRLAELIIQFHKTNKSLHFQGELDGQRLQRMTGHTLRFSMVFCSSKIGFLRRSIS